MHFGRDFTHPEFGGNLLVHQSCRDQPDDFLLAGGQGLEAGSQLRDRRFSCSTLAIAFERELNRVEKILIAKRLGQELDGAGFHRAHRHWHVSETGNEDNGDLNVRFGQLGLKIEPTEARQADVENKTGRGGIAQLGFFQEIGGRAERLDAQTDRLQQAYKGRAQRGVVIDDENNRIGCGMPLHDPS